MKLTSTLATRVTPETRKAFKVKASRYGDPSYVHRELIVAFIEGRFKIQAPKNHFLNQEIQHDN